MNFATNCKKFSAKIIKSIFYFNLPGTFSFLKTTVNIFLKSLLTQIKLTNPYLHSR